MGYLVLLVDELKKLSHKKLEKLKSFLKGVESKNVSIFTDGNGADDEGSLQEAIDIVNALGINYKEGKRKFMPIAKMDTEKKFEISMKCTVGSDSGRIITKIAFNYFAFCAIKEGREDILFHQNFSKLKSYILGEKEFPIKEIITAVENEPIIFEEKTRSMRFIGHTVTFSNDQGQLISKVSFLGKKIYTIMLAPLPPELSRHDFGSGHFFDPINKKIFGLTQNPAKWGSNQKTGFGLFNRV